MGMKYKWIDKRSGCPEGENPGNESSELISYSLLDLEAVFIVADIVFYLLILLFSFGPPRLRAIRTAYVFFNSPL